MKRSRYWPLITSAALLPVFLFAQEWNALYTTSADFDRGSMIGLEHATVSDQLQLSKVPPITFPFIWVPNSNEGTVSKVDTRTGKECGRYRTGPKSNGSPSRTTVDIKGNCWVGNRQTGTVVKLGLYENGQYEDRNGNGIIETSQDLNGDGNITGEEILPWGKDECVLFEILLLLGSEATYKPGEYTGTYANDSSTPGPRGLAVDAQNNLWAGTFGTKRLYYIDGADGKILKTVNVSSVNHTSYGAVIDRLGFFWSSGHQQNHLLRLNPRDNTYQIINIGHFVYGLGVDKNNHLFVSGYDARKVSRVNVESCTKEWTVAAGYQSRGVAVTLEGDFWVANTGDGNVTRYSNDGVLKATIAVGSQPTGVATDADGKVWVVNLGDENIHRIDPATNKIDLSKRIVGGTHYGYSDMTGVIVRTVTTRTGNWTVIHDAETLNTAWGKVSWNAETPAGTSLSVRVRSSNNQTDWSVWESAPNGQSLAKTTPGRYLQVEVTMQDLTGSATPILYDLSIAPASRAVCGFFYPNPFNPEIETGYFALCHAGQTEIQIYDAANTRVTTLVSTTPSTAKVPWDGRDDQGRIVANGLYFFLIKPIDGEMSAGKIGVIK